MLRRSRSTNQLQPHSTQRGMDYTGISSDVGSAGVRGRAVAGFRGEAFGIGALEEKEEYGVYDNDDRSNYNTVITDASDDIDLHKTHLYKSSRSNYLDNFVFGGKGSEYIRKTYPPPAIPPGYKPWHETGSKVEVASSEKAPKSVEERAAVLGVSETADKRPSVSTFKPYTKDPEKHKRYTEYLKTRNVDYSESNLTEWERNQEIDEFKKSAKFFRPLGGGLASKFTSAGCNTDDNIKQKLEKQADEERGQAVGLKMFGRLTRETHEWCPANLLCKRFDVANPYPK